MRGLLICSLIFFGGAILLNLLEPIVRRCRRRLQQYEEAEVKQELARVGSEPPREALVEFLPSRDAHPSAAGRTPDVPADETAGFYLRRFINQGGLLGLFLAPLLIVFLALNARILAEAFERLLDRAGVVVGTISVWGMTIEVTDLLLYGLALATAQFLLGAVYAETCEAQSPLRWFVLMAGLISIWVFEVGVSAVHGYMSAATDEGAPGLLLGPAWWVACAAGRGLQASVCAITEVLSGFWMVHKSLLPLIQAGLWGTIAPFRWLKRRWATRREKAGEAPRKQVPAQADLGVPRPSILVRLGAYLDEAFFDPLRRLDELVVSLWRRLGSARGVSHA